MLLCCCFCLGTLCCLRISFSVPNFSSSLSKVLFKGEHTLSKTVVHSTIGGLAAFTKKRSTCIGCKALLPKEDMVVCQHCGPREAELYLNEITKMAAMEEKFARLWTECQQCQGMLHEEVVCSNNGKIDRSD